MAQQQSNSFVDERKGDFWINALIGAALSFFLSWLMISPIIGGAVAGFLQQESRGSGAKVGAMAGIISAIPIFLTMLLLLGTAGISILAAGSAVGMVILLVIVVGGILASAVYAGGLGAIGGYIGAMIQESDDDSDADADAEYEQPPADQGYQSQGTGQSTANGGQSTANTGYAAQGSGHAQANAGQRQGNAGQPYGESTTRRTDARQDSNAGSNR